MKLNRKKILYYVVKLAKQSGTPEFVARGVFIGLFIGLVVPFGLQILVALPLAFVFKANKITAVGFTFITNQASIFFIYPFQCFVGSYVIAHPISYAHLSARLKSFLHFLVSSKASIRKSYEELMLLGQEIVIPFFVGGVVLGILVGILGYFASLYLVRQVRGRKERRKQQRLNNKSKAEPTQ